MQKIHKSIYISKDVANQIEKLAKKEIRPFSQMVEIILKKEVDKCQNKQQEKSY